MKMTVEEIVNKYKDMISPLIGLLTSKKINEEVVRVFHSDDKRSLVIRKDNYIPGKGFETIYIAWDQKVKVDYDGSFDFIHNNERFNVLIMIPLIKEQQ